MRRDKEKRNWGKERRGRRKKVGRHRRERERRGMEESRK